jgi:ATP-dependent DNA helicase RecG
MTRDQIQHLLQQGEGFEIEFKTAYFELNKDTFDSICAFLNRKGGHLLLGVTNNGQVEGVLESAVPTMINNLINCANNPTKLDPPFSLDPQVIDYDGKKIIYVFVPEGKLAHRHNGRIFDRNGDADVDVTRLPYSVLNVYARKFDQHAEDRVLPFVEMADLNTSLFERIRITAALRQREHPWKQMTDWQIIHSAGLYKTDPTTGKSGLTLAAILLLGKETTLLNALPQHRTDAIVRVDDLDRYDDRDCITANLIESFDRLMAFIEKHLPDRFYLEGVKSISLRHRLFREVVSNLLIHRAHTDLFPAKLIIQRDQVYTENWCIPRTWGPINPKNFAPYSKNPKIARFFREIGDADELGSGVRKIFRDNPIYTPGAMPELVECDVFKTIIPIKPIGFQQIHNQPIRRKIYGDKEVQNNVQNDVENNVETLTKTEVKILQLINQNGVITISGLAKKLKISMSTIDRHITKLKKKKILSRIGPDKGGHWNITL